MGVRGWIGNKLFNIDKVVDDKVSERMQRFSINESNDLLKYRMLENRTWAKGNADVILEFYKTQHKPSTFNTERLLFWNWVGGIHVPKLHYPAPVALLNSMKSLLFGSPPSVEFVVEKDDKKENLKGLNERLEKILVDNHINEFYQNGAVMESYSGTIAAKFVIDKNISDTPIIELYPQERIDLTVKYNRVTEITFKDYYKLKNKEYELKSIYGLGYIDYILVEREKNKEVPLSTLEETKDLERTEFKDKDGNLIKILMATYKKNRTVNAEFPDSGFGGSDFEGIIDLFHQIDEIYSTMAVYLRRTRPSLTISEILLPITKDGRDSVVPKEYEFDITVLKQTESAAKAEDYLRREVPELNLSVYIEAIKELQKAIYQKVGYSNVTANLDAIGSNLSGVAMTELEKATLILYQNKVVLWQKFLKDTFRLSLIYEDIMNTKTIKTDYTEYDLNVTFADYHDDTLEDRIKTFGEAYKNSVIDVETMVKEVWKKNLTDEQIMAMVKNIKIENGIPILQSQVGDE